MYAVMIVSELLTCYSYNTYSTDLDEDMELLSYSYIFHKDFSKWAMTWDFQKCGTYDQQRLRPACAYA